MATQYNFLDNNFTSFKPVETSKVEIKMPLMEDSLDISDWATGITESGTPLVKQSEEVVNFIHNNPEVSSSTNYQIRKGVTGTSKEILNFFTSKGLSPQQAAGIVGNLYVESKFNTNAVGDNGTAFGIAQWRKDRQDGLRRFAASRGTSASDLNTQLEYIWKELNSSHKRAYQRLLGSKTAKDATLAFSDLYEIPNKAKSGNDRRIKYAESLLTS